MDKISLAGDLGSGKSTVSAILLRELGAEYYSTGSIVRSIADKMNMSVVELNHYMETHPEIDNMIDDGIAALSDDPRMLVIDSRMAWHFTRGTFKVYMTVDLETSALRIMNANRKGEHSATLEETVESTRARRLSEQKRYMDQYGVDIKDLMNYDLIVDTTYASPEQVAEVIISSFKEWQRDKNFTSRAYICPERLCYPDDEPDHKKVAEYSGCIESGEGIPEISVSESCGEFYVIGGVESALAYSFNMDTYVPCTLVPFSESNAKYVKMKNSI